MRTPFYFILFYYFFFFLFLFPSPSPSLPTGLSFPYLFIFSSHLLSLQQSPITYTLVHDSSFSFSLLQPTSFYLFFFFSTPPPTLLPFPCFFFFLPISSLLLQQSLIFLKLLSSLGFKPPLTSIVENVYIPQDSPFSLSSRPMSKLTES